MDPETERNGGPLVWIAVIVIVLSVSFVVVLPGLLSVRSASPERNVAGSMKSLAAAEADFRANDRDWNRVNDYWTGDVKGLYTMTSAAVRGAVANSTTDPAMKLVELSLAAADADPASVPAGGENLPLSQFAVPSAKAGYWFAAMTADGSLDLAKPEARYRQDTGGDPVMGPCHNIIRFGFVAFPDSQSAGSFVWIVNENNTIYRSAATMGVMRGAGIPPGTGALPAAYLTWPSEADLKKGWERVDFSH